MNHHEKVSNKKIEIVPLNKYKNYGFALIYNEDLKNLKKLTITIFLIGASLFQIVNFLGLKFLLFQIFILLTLLKLLLKKTNKKILMTD